MNFRYSINAFKTKQVLDKSYQNYTLPYETEKWWGEYNKKYNFDTIKKLLADFDNYRDKYFELVHKSDYRDTYKSKNYDLDVYLKHYRVADAKYSKFTILKRNILRRTLAKKSFAMTFILNNLNIPTIESILFSGSRNEYICKEGIYVSLAEPNTVPLSYYFETLSEKRCNNDFTESFCEKISVFPIENIISEYGFFVRNLIEKGIRGSQKEFFGNTLIHFQKNHFKLLLCDLDIIDAIFSYSAKEKEYIFNTIDSHINAYLDNLKISCPKEAFKKGLERFADEHFTH